MEELTKNSRPFEFKLPYGGEKACLLYLTEQLELLLEKPLSPDRTGLYVASPNAGFLSSLSFWTEVLEKSPAFANPELFPWTLANAPCGAIARKFQITGPNYTYCIKKADLPIVEDQIGYDFNAHLIDSAWLLYMDFSPRPGRNGHIWGKVYTR